MDKVRLILNLVTIAIVTIPIVGMLLTHQSNLVGLFAPPEIIEAINNLVAGDGDDRSVLEPPRIVNEPEYDEATQTFSLKFEYHNSFPLDININSLSGNIECNEHRFSLAAVSLREPVSIGSGKTETLVVIGAWNDMAENHFETNHSDEEFVDVVLVDLTMDVSGIQVELDNSQLGQGMEVPNPVY